MTSQMHDVPIVTLAREKQYLAHISILYTVVFANGRVRNYAIPVDYM